MKIDYRNLIYDIRFWIIISFIVRLYGITNPPLEVAHNWRQTTVTMPARNFYEEGPDLFHPKIDFAGEKTGITGMEFPVFNYLIFLFATIFSYDHWYGRLINLIISSIGIFYFYKLVLKYLNKETAFYSSVILICSLWFSFSRKIMPDTFSASLVITAIYFGLNYLEKGNKNIVAYFLLALVGVLSKISSSFLLALPLLLFFDSSIELKRKIIFSIATVLIFIPVYLWYFHWVPYLLTEYEFQHFYMGKSFAEGLTDIKNNFAETLKRFYDTALKYSGFIFFIIGLVIILIKKEKRLILTFLVLFFAFLPFVIKTGYNFSHHTYYIIPFVPVMAFFAGFALSNIKNKKIAAVFLIIIGIEGVVNQVQDFKIKDDYRSMLELEKDLDSVSGRNDLIVINSDGNPTPMYFAHRKGWIMRNDELNSSSNIEDLKDKGAKFIVILKKAFGNETNIDAPLLLVNNNYKIYKIER